MLKVLYVTSKGGIHDYRFLKKLIEDYKVLLLHYEADSLIDEIKSLKKLEIISKKPFLKSFPLLSEYNHFKKICREFKPDIVHTGYIWQVGILAAFLNFHPHLSMPWGSDIMIEPGKSFLIRFLTRKVLNQCDHIQCDAYFVKQKIAADFKIPEDKITVFPWGIDLKIFRKLGKKECRDKLKIDKDKFIVIFSRHLEPVYGINYLLNGFKKFINSKDNVILLIIADGKLRNETEKFISSNGLTDKIRLIGRIPNDLLPVYLNASDVYVSPSLSDGTSLSLLEAMACGLGLVVTELPAIKEWVSDKNGISVPVQNSDAISAALQRYYEDSRLIKEHGQRSISLAGERADWDKNYLKLREIYSKLTNS